METATNCWNISDSFPLSVSYEHLCRHNLFHSFFHVLARLHPGWGAGRRCREGGRWWWWWWMWGFPADRCLNNASVGWQTVKPLCCPDRSSSAGTCCRFLLFAAGRRALGVVLGPVLTQTWTHTHPSCRSLHLADIPDTSGTERAESTLVSQLWSPSNAHRSLLGFFQVEKLCGCLQCLGLFACVSSSDA